MYHTIQHTTPILILNLIFNDYYFRSYFRPSFYETNIMPAHYEFTARVVLNSLFHISYSYLILALFSLEKMIPNKMLTDFLIYISKSVRHGSMLALILYYGSLSIFSNYYTDIVRVT